MNRLDRLSELEKYFINSSYRSLVLECQVAFYAGESNTLDKVLAKFPSKEQLYVSLLEKLRGKSVYRNLRKITEGKVKNTNECLKGLSSLLTHVCIEAKCNPEYGILIVDIYEKMGELVYKLV